LFGDGWEKAWDNDLLLCTAHKLAALTGIRCCELLGLRGEFVFDDHIYICAQHDNKYGYRDTKTKTKHNIPLTAEVIADLNKLKEVNGDGYIFSLTGGEKPVSRKHIWAGLKKALKKIGISYEEYKARGLNVHAWRHFCNTEMQMAGMTVKKVQAVTGHKTEEMTDRYTHLDPMELKEVTEIQEALLAKKPKAKKTERPALTLVKMPVDENTETNKQAS
jgi:integrase